MTDKYIVTAPYVTLRVKDQTGAEVLLGFYEAAPVPDSVDKDDLERHLRKGMIAKAGTEEADAASPVGRPVQFDAAGMPAPAKTAGEGRPDGQPALYASKSAWVDYAVTQRADGVSEEDARADAEGKSKAELLAEHGA